MVLSSIIEVRDHSHVNCCTRYAIFRIQRMQKRKSGFHDVMDMNRMVHVFSLKIENPPRKKPREGDETKRKKKNR